MRRIVLNRITEMLPTIWEGVKYAKTVDEQAATDMLCNCYAMVNTVEATLKNGFSEARFAFYQKIIMAIKDALEEVNNALASKVSSSAVSDNLKHLLNRLKKEISDEKELTYKVVFFAELSSKWDSLESLYYAFKKREDCDVEVVIAPIFREVEYINGQKKRDVLYSDYLTPRGISNTPYEQYSIEKDLPDMAITCQPYESVTPVQFWAEYISKYTRLVYVPYFTAMHNKPEAICQKPMDYYAWRILVQSDKVLDIYKKHAVNKGENVLVTGLPKWDIIKKVPETPIPDEWRKKTEGKNVFLFNSHYNMKNTTYFEEFCDFFEKRNDAALIWRPHPMTETIFKLYYPEQYDRWNNVIKRVNNSSNMIVDFSEMYLPAFAASCALISPTSSLIQQYILTEKPIFIWYDQTKLSNQNLWVMDYTGFDCLKTPKGNEPKPREDYFADLNEFVVRICSGNDCTKQVREDFICREMTNSDKNIGEFVCSVLIDNLEKENR